MRVLIVIHAYPPSYVGGAELRAERTARELAVRNHEVAVLCIESVKAPETRLVTGDRLQDGVQVHRLYVKSRSELADGYETGDEHVVSRYLGQLLGAWRPEVIHLFSGYLMGSDVIATAKHNHIPVVVSVTDFWWLCHRINLVRASGSRCDGPVPVECARCQFEIYRRYRLPANWAPQLADGFWSLTQQMPVLGSHYGIEDQARRQKSLLAALNQADAIVAPSRFIAEKHKQHGVAGELIRVWRQGVDLRMCPLRKASPALRFGYLGQIKKHKGVHTLIEAWGYLKPSRPRNLAVFGSAQGEHKYGQRLRDQSKQFANVTWQEPVPHSEIWNVLSELDVLVVPSRWNENSPNVILEAQAMGVPVIGTNLGGVAELVQHERNGLLFEPDDAQDLASQMTRLLDEPELLPALKANPFPFHSFRDELDQLEGLYRQLSRAPEQSTRRQVVLGTAESVTY